MAREFEVKTRLTAQDDASSTIKGASASIDSLNSSALASEAALGVITAGVAALVAGLRFSIQASNEQEDSLVRLSTALNLRGVGEFKNALVEQANALQLVTRFSDDAIERAQALLATYGVTGDSLRTATQATVDLAAALDIDLGSAANQVGAAFNGITRGLEKLVPDLKSASEAGFDGAQNMDLLAKSLNGVAEATAKTTSGEWAKINNQIGELGEKSGDAAKKTDYFTSVLWALKAVLPVLNEAMTDSSTPVTEYGDAFAQLVKEQEAAIRTVTKLADIQDRATRIMSENATAMSEQQRIAKEYGLTLQSEVAAAELKRQEDLRRLDELLRLTGDSLVDNSDKTGTNTDAVDRNSEAINRNIGLKRQEIVTLAESTRAVVFNAQAWEYLERTQGRAAANQGALDAGGRIVNAGSSGRGGRVMLPGGGSRLLHPSTSGGSFGG